MLNQFLSRRTELLSEWYIIFYGLALLVLVNVKLTILFRISPKQQKYLKIGRKEKNGQANSKCSRNIQGLKKQKINSGCISTYYAFQNI